MPGEAMEGEGMAEGEDTNVPTALFMLNVYGESERAVE